MHLCTGWISLRAATLRCLTSAVGNGISHSPGERRMEQDVRTKEIHVLLLHLWAFAQISIPRLPGCRGEPGGGQETYGRDPKPAGPCG